MESVGNEDVILQCIAVATSGLSFVSGSGLSVVCWMARYAAVRGTHSDNMLLLLSVLGAFDALYAASFLLDAAAVFMDGRDAATYSSLNAVADFLFAYATCTSLLSAILAWYLYRAFVWTADPEPMRRILLRLMVLATVGMPVAACVAFAAAYGDAAVSYWLQLSVWIVVEGGALLAVTTLYARIQCHFAAVRSAADAEMSGQTTGVLAASLHARLSLYLLVFVLTQFPPIFYYAWGGHFQLDLPSRHGVQPRGSVPFALAVVRVTTQPLTGFANSCVYWHHARQRAARVRDANIEAMWSRCSYCCWKSSRRLRASMGSMSTSVATGLSDPLASNYDDREPGFESVERVVLCRDGQSD